MTIYLATERQMPTIPFDERNPKLNTQDITDEEKLLKILFSKPHIKYIGSDQGCGCGFRHALLENGEWFNVLEEEEFTFQNSNQINLVDFISENNRGDKTVEILACWNGDHAEQVKYWERIRLLDILNQDFSFKERGYYTVQI